MTGGREFVRLISQWFAPCLPMSIFGIARRIRPSSFGDVVKCCLGSWYGGEAVEEMHEKKLDEECMQHRHATEGAEAQPDYFLKPDVAQLQVPIFASPRDI
ncbi:hypothetical protein Tco_0892775 [Tanacetum coccineum]|uniref:Uncharacterized protein n=1 Tax=Tanacetum coccineum TaxID=301880 RepID=A0ABQ5C879_9ASTR